MTDMARKQITVLICDECGKPEAEHFTLSMPEGKVQLDLCREHAEPLYSLRQMKRSRPGAMRPRRVLSVEEAKRL